MCHKPFSSLSRLGWDISKFLKTWMRSDHFQVFKAWMRSDFFWSVIFKFLKTWISWCCCFIGTWENLVWSTLMVVMSLKDPFSRLSRLGWGLDIPVRETDNNCIPSCVVVPLTVASPASCSSSADILLWCGILSQSSSPSSARMRGEVFSNDTLTHRPVALRVRAHLTHDTAHELVVQRGRLSVRL